MKNEYGAKLDRNGYAPSIIQDWSEYPCCYLCMKTSGKLDRHEVFFGANREKSKRYGLWVLLCDAHHEHGQNAVHQNAEISKDLKQAAQIKAMNHYHWTEDDFRSIFGKSYLEEEDDAAESNP